MVSEPNQNTINSKKMQGSTSVDIKINNNSNSISLFTFNSLIWFYNIGMAKLFGISFHERFRLLLNSITMPRSTTKLLVLSILVLTSALGYAAPDFNADLNGDTVVNSLDISKLASCFKQNPISNRACTPADVDNDGDIDQDDFNFVTTRIGEVYYERLFFSPGDSRYGRLIANEDLNDDGSLDFVFTDDNIQGSILVMLSNGDGSFQEQRYSDGYTHNSMFSNDMNGDGVLDLVTTAGGVSILLGNGNGGFQTPQRYGIDIGSGPMLSGDLNGDGALDIIVANIMNRNSLSVLLGNGDGSLQEQQNYDINLMPFLVFLDDMNGDHILDLLVTNSFSEDIEILLGNGDGSFRVQQSFVAGSSRRSILLSDINGDDIPDLMIVNRWGDENIWVLLGNGDGSFQEHHRFSVGNGPLFSVLGDLDGDKNIDLVVSSGSSGDLTVLLGNGDGSFQVQQRYDIGSTNSRSALLEDINNDNKIDIITFGYQSITILLGHGDGGFSQQQSIATGLDPISLAVADIDSDGILDLVLSNGTLLFGIGNGSFETVRNVAELMEIQSLALGDLNGDDILDLVVPDYLTRSFVVYFGNGDNSFQTGPLYYVGAGQAPQSVVLVELNGDGVLDLVIAIEDAHHGVGGVSVLLGNGDGSFQAEQRVVMGVSFAIKLGDLNSDGDLDLVFVSSTDSRLSMMLGNGDGSFQGEQLISTELEWYAPIFLGEVNGDGAIDIILNSGDMFINNGDGSFGPRQHLGINSVIALEDLNNDNTNDIILANGNILLGNGDGGFESGQPISSGGGSAVLGDLNGDAVVDLVFFGDGVSVMLGNGDGTYQATFPIGQYNRVPSVVLGDVNGNGRLDMLLVEDNVESHHDTVWIVPNRGQN
jgi:hypothetical protein